MTGLTFKKLWILSKTQKAARQIELSPTVNVITGENDVGKSTLIKSLYHTLGANAPQMNNTRWSKARPIYCVLITLNGDDFFIVRDGKFFGVFDENKQLLSRHKGVGGESGIGQFLCSNLGFRVELELNAKAELSTAGPAFYFLPFYVDQDEGWATTWTSFTGLKQFKNYRKNMIEYHLGVRPQKYYDAKRVHLQLSEKLGSCRSERNALEAVRRSYRERKQLNRVDMDPSVFQREIEELVDRFNEVFEEQQTVLGKLKDVRGRRNAIDNELEVLKGAIAELDADYKLAESPKIPDVIDCPTCGTGIENSMVERFGLLDDIDFCESAIDERRKERIVVQSSLMEIEQQYGGVSDRLSTIDELLSRKRKEVSFSDLIRSEGIKELDSSITVDIETLGRTEAELEQRIEGLADDLKVDSSLKRKIVSFYQARMKEFLNQLNVHVLEEDDYKRLDQVIKNNALGSDLPRSLLAQYFAFLHTMEKFNDFVHCPMVIDSPQQQEQDDTNLAAIFSLIFSKALPHQQLILGTLSLDGVTSEHIPADALRVHLDTKFHLLMPAEYEAVSDEVSEMHAEMLAS